MSIQTFGVAMFFAVAIALAIYGFFRFFRFLPEYLDGQQDGLKSIFRFRYVEYDTWLKHSHKNHGNGPLYFAAGFALALMAFPFLLLLK